MGNTLVFDLDEVIAIDADHRLIVMVGDDDEIPPIVAARCPDCRMMVRDFKHHQIEDVTGR